MITKIILFFSIFFIVKKIMIKKLAKNLFKEIND